MLHLLLSWAYARHPAELPRKGVEGFEGLGSLGGWTTQLWASKTSALMHVPPACKYVPCQHRLPCQSSRSASTLVFPDS